MRRLPLIALAIAAGSLAACGGGSHSIPALTNTTGTTQTPGTGSPQSSQKSTASVKITIPAKTSTTMASGTRSPQYISASTQSMVFSSLDSSGKATQLAEFDLTPTSPGCAAVTGGGTQCSETLGAPSGPNTFQVTAYDATGGKGNALSTATLTATLTAGSNNTIPLVMDGVAASAQVVVGTGTLPVGTAGSTIVTVQAKDAQGNTIVGPGGFTNPFTLAIANDTYGTLKLSQATIAKPGDVATLAYNGNSLVGATINATASNVTTTGATVAGSGYVVTQLAGADYGNWNCGTASSGPIYGYGSTYTYSLAPMGTNLAAEVSLYEYCNGQSLSQDGLAVVTPSGTTTLYMGDTPDPTVSPTPTPAPGATPAPPPGIVLVHGMSTGVQERPGNSYSTVATLGTKIFYSAAFNQSTTINGAAATIYNKGVVGVLDTSTNTVKETVLQGGAPAAIRVAPNGDAYFVTGRAPWYCLASGGCYNYNPSGANISYYEVGAVDSSGNLLSEQSFDAIGMPLSANPRPQDMTLSADGASMYIAIGASANSIAKLPISGQTVGAATLASLGPDYPLAIAAGTDGNVLTTTNYEPSNNYYFAYVPGSSFTDSSVVNQPFTAQPYVFAESVAYGDGSYWLADDDGGGIGRISSVGSGAHMEYIQNPVSGSNRTYLCGIALVGGAVWGADCSYGGFVRVAYGAPSQNGIVGQSTIRSVGSANRVANPKPHTQSTALNLVPLPAPHPIF